MMRLVLFLAVLMATAPVSIAQDATTAPSEAAPDQIAGVVTDEAGKPITGATVDAWSWYTGNETRTDKDGKFLLKNLPQHHDPQVELKIYKTGYSPWYNYAQPLASMI